MKYWEKILRRASNSDKDRLEQVILKLENRELPNDVIKLSDRESYRVRVGNWRIQFHYESDIVVIDEVNRRRENTYK